MTRFILRIIALGLAGPAISASHSGIVLAGCVAETGELFAIDAYGDGSAGTLFAVSQRGTTCRGVWRSPRGEKTIASFECDDGRRAGAIFDAFDPDEPKINATGGISDGTTLHFWNVEPEPNCWRQ